MITFKSQDRTYEWCGGFGAMFKSRENGMDEGEVRMIEGELFYVFYVARHCWRDEVCWTQPHVSAEAIRLFKQRVCGV